MYLYANEPLGQLPTSLQSCNLTTGSGRGFGLAASAVDGFGEVPPGWEHIPLKQRERLREEIRNNRVVQAIRRLPEGNVCPAPEHLEAYEQRIINQLWQSFSFYPGELGKGLDLWRLSMGYPPRPPMREKPLNTGPSMRATEPGEEIRNAIYTAQVLEEQFILAERTKNYEGMAKASKEYYQLLNRFPPQGPGKSMPGREVWRKTAIGLRKFAMISCDGRPTWQTLSD